VHPLDRYPLQFVSVNQHRTAYIRHGQGPPLVLLHGYAGAMWNWEHQIEPLGRHFTLFIPDVLGHGLTDKPHLAYTSAVYLEWLRGFLDAVGIERTHIAGNSMGAGLALGLALTYPARTDRLILISGFPAQALTRIRGSYLELIYRLGSGWLFALGYRCLGRRAFRQFLGNVICDPARITPAVVERCYRLRKDHGQAWPLWSSLRHLNEWEAHFAPRLKDITAPVLILWGRDDRFLPVAIGHELHRMIPHARFTVIPQAGHLPMWEQPADVNRLIIEFLAT